MDFQAALYQQLSVYIYFAIKLILLSSFFRHEYETLIYIPQKDAFRDMTSMNTLMPTN